MADLARLRAIVHDTDPRETVGDRLPLLPAMQRLCRTVRRGSVVTIEGEAARSSLAMVLLAGVSAAGGWCGVVGVPTFGALAAYELGIRMDTLALVPHPGPAWADVVAALITGTDAVLVAPPERVPAGLARRLAARARQHRCTVLTLGTVWEGSDLRLSAVSQEWFGLRQGSGRLRSRRITAVASHRPRASLELWLPGSDGRVRVAETRGSTPTLSVVHTRPRTRAG
jgi:hypothetical protein